MFDIDSFVASLRCKTIVKKSWGMEYWVENEPEYCQKFLKVIPGEMCSLHYHPIKTETHIIAQGKIFLELGDFGPYPNLIREMNIGDRQKIYAKTPHRFWSGSEGGWIMELSTLHDEGDVVRLIQAGSVWLREQPIKN